MAKVAQSLAKLISQSKKKKTGPYDTQATVKRVEGNTVWVSIPGGVDETPINKTVNCSAGDKVQVRVSGGRAWITGNASAPPTDDKRANEAKTTADNAQVMAVDAKETAKAVESVAVNANNTATTAKTIAEGVNEHFWHDNTGAHVTEVTQEEWNEPTDPNYHSGGNTLITTQGMAIRNGLTNLAEFGASGATIGVSGSQIAHLGYGPGTDSGGGTSDAPYYTLGVRTGTVGNYSTAEGINATASAYCSHAEGYQTTSSGLQSHAEGLNTIASGNSGSHAEGATTHATGSNSHSEGFQTTASGAVSHAEGGETTASGFRSHAEGAYTTASGDYSHAQNLGTIADQQNQTAVGKYNTEGNTDNLFVVGNGTALNARHDAFQVDKSGNVEAAGNITDGSNNVLSNKADSAGLFKVVDLSWTEPVINAHNHGTNTTHTVPSADRPDGMVLVGIVGWTSGNYRIYPYVYNVNGAHSISVTMANATAGNSASATVHAYLLYIKATSA